MAAVIEPQSIDEHAEIASKILRRAQVSKVTRALQDHLTLANIKVKRGWVEYSIDVLEPKVELEIRRKRGVSSDGALSDGSPSMPEQLYISAHGHGHGHRGLDSNLLHEPVFSDGLPRNDSGYGSRKKVKHHAPNSAHAQLTRSDHAGTYVQSMHYGLDPDRSWKSNSVLPEFGHAYGDSHVHYNCLHKPRLPFSETFTTADPSLSPTPESEQDDEDLPVMSFQSRGQSYPRNNITLFPHSTGSPDAACSARLRSELFINDPTISSSKDDFSGNESPMSLVARPSPAVSEQARTTTNSPENTPVTPSQTTPLPPITTYSCRGSDSGLLGFVAATPGLSFKFSDYINTTPSPAQATWRKPGAIREISPMVEDATWRRSSFDWPVPPSRDSQKIGKGRLIGLGLDLGRELVSLKRDDEGQVMK